MTTYKFDFVQAGWGFVESSGYSCASFIADGSAQYGIPFVSCSSDPVSVGTTVRLYAPQFGFDQSLTVKTITPPPPSGTASSVDLVPFAMDVPTAVQIGTALLLIFAVAFVWRMARRALEDQSHYDT